jgi:filamentous hemagglutinin family protein
MKKYSIQKLKGLMATSSLLFAASLCIDGLQTVGKAEITATPNDAGTIINQNDNAINITGGTAAEGNLFHSFEKFRVNENQTANFISNPSIQNILGRVTGGAPSAINGVIQVTGGNSNLYLMNPAGIIFGSGARLDIRGAFTATTANGIGFGNGWFNATGNNNYTALVGSPNAFAFTMSQPGAIINAGTLEVGEGKDLTLLGGTVANTGELKSSGGNITVGAIPSEQLVSIKQQGNLLTLEVRSPLKTDSLPTNWALPISSLPELLTGGNVGNATGIQVNEDNTVSLTGSGAKIDNGYFVSSGTIEASSTTPNVAGNIYLESLQGDVTIGNSQLTSSGNIYLESLQGDVTIGNSQLTSSGNLQLLAQKQVQIRDTSSNSISLVRADGDLYIQGKEGININALNSSLSWFKSTNDLSLVSDGVITGNGRFATSGDFSTRKLSGEPTGFNITSTSSNGIISSQGDVTFGDYKGVALKVEARGNIIATGNIEIEKENPSILTGINQNQPILTKDQDIPILANSPALILRAGVTELRHSPNISGTSVEGATFTSTTQPSSGSITVNGDITTKKGPVILSATGDITVGNITTEGIFYKGYEPSYYVSRSFLGGYVNLSSGGDITVETINAYGSTDSAGGDITIKAIGIFQAIGSFLTFVEIEDKYQPGGSTRNNLVPTSILTGSSTFGNPLGFINIQHGGSSFRVGPQFEKDPVTKEVIYQLVQENPNGNMIIGPENEKRVSFTGIKVYPEEEGNSLVFRDKETGNIYDSRYNNGSNLINIAPISTPLTINELANSKSTSFTAGAIASTSGGNGYMPLSVRDLPFNTNISGSRESLIPIQVNFIPPTSKPTDPITGNIGNNGAETTVGGNSSGTQGNTRIDNGVVNNPPIERIQQNTPTNSSSSSASGSNGSTSSNSRGTQDGGTDRGIANNAPTEEIQQNALINRSSSLPSSNSAGFNLEGNQANSSQECNATEMKHNGDGRIELTGSCVPKKSGNSSSFSP